MNILMDSMKNIVDKNKENKKQKQKIICIPYPMKKIYNIIIPPNIFQTWHSKILPPLMFNAVNNLRRVNPKFRYNLYDDNDCRYFIEQNFDSNILNAYDKLIPGAYKADLWRYCILYKYGGIYLDVKYIPIKGFKLINLTEKEHWVLDIGGNRIYNALIAVMPSNPVLLKAINKIVENVNNKYYGFDCLDITGPGLLANFFSKEEKNNFDMNHELLLGSHDNRIINYNGYMVLRSYYGYINESTKYAKVENYSKLWHNRNVYN